MHPTGKGGTEGTTEPTVPPITHSTQPPLKTLTGHASRVIPLSWTQGTVTHEDSATERQLKSLMEDTATAALPSTSDEPAGAGDSRPRVLILFAGPGERADSLKAYLEMAGSSVNAIDVRIDREAHDVTIQSVRDQILLDVESRA